MPNALNVIRAYNYAGVLVFDDAGKDLDSEPLVEGADTLIDKALAARGIPSGDDGFRLLFSAGEFPRYDLKLAWLREGEGGNYHMSADFGLEAWLCPALFKYFESAPKEIYVRLECLSA